MEFVVKIPPGTAVEAVETSLETVVEPSPATHAIWIVLKAGQFTVHDLMDRNSGTATISHIFLASRRGLRSLVPPSLRGG